MKITKEKINGDGTVNLEFDLTDDDEKMLKELAESLKMTKEQALVYALEEWVKNQKEDVEIEDNGDEI